MCLVGNGDETREFGNFATRSSARLQAITRHAKAAIVAAFDVETRVKSARYAPIFQLRGQDLVPIGEEKQAVVCRGLDADHLLRLDARIVLDFLVPCAQWAPRQVGKHLRSRRWSGWADSDNHPLFDANLVEAFRAPRTPKGIEWRAVRGFEAEHLDGLTART